MTMLRLMPGTKLRLGAAILVALLVLAACGGDDETFSGNGRSDSERIAALEEQMKAFQEYIVAQAKKDRERGGSSTHGHGAEPLYTLAKKDASENELEIVRWMADCTARTYLNPDLPKEVIEREITESERRMWQALEAGQYGSFEAYIGMAFSFCQARIVEENQK